MLSRTALKLRHVWAAGMVAFFAMNATGCLFHDLKPHRLWRWNRTDAMMRDPTFSIPTPEIPADWQPATGTAVDEAPSADQPQDPHAN